MRIVEGITHGYSGYNRHGCQCNTCRVEYSAYRRRVRRQKAYGRWQPFVDAQPVRDHARALMAVGVGWRRIAELADVSGNCANRLLYSRGAKPPVQKVRTDVAARILAIPVTADMAALKIVDAIGTQRRIQGLAALDWSVTFQADRIGWKRENIYTILRARNVSAETARLVADMYEDLSTRWAPRNAGTAAVRRAVRRNRWFRPLAWVEGTIDDPAAAPALLPPVDGSDPAADEWEIQHLMADHETVLDRPTQLEVVRRLTDEGWFLPDIAARLGRSVSFVRDARKAMGLSITTSEGAI